MPSLFTENQNKSDEKALSMLSTIAAKKKAETEAIKAREAKSQEALGGFKTYIKDLEGKTPQGVSVQQIENEQTRAAREQQLASMALMQQAAQGMAPSAAQMQMRMGLDQAVRNQMAMAQSGRGGFNPAATRAAMLQGSQMQQQGIGQAAALRAQEMAAARDAYFGATSQVRGMDAQSAQAQAAMNYQADAFNRNLYANREQFLAGLQGQYMGGVLGYDQAQMNALLQQQQMRQQKALADEAANRQLFGAILGGVGTVAGAYFGGPAGAAAGGAIGKGLGQAGG